MPYHLTSFQLGVLFLPKTLQSVPQFSCTEKRSNQVVPNRSFLSFYYRYANVSLSFFMSQTYTQDKLSLGKNIKTKLVTLCWQGDEEKDPSAEVVRLPVPYQLPPQLYGPEG